MSGPSAPSVSVVVPVYNEEANLEALHARLSAVLDGLPGSSEMVLVDDGSRDRSFEILARLAARDPRLSVVRFNRNYGQHAAVFAGLERARGDVVVTLDADLQNPPEEIPKLLAKIDEGYDVVGGWRKRRHDSALRRWPSRVLNAVMSKATGVRLNDYGCMLRAYRRDVIDAILRCDERSTFIPALANLFASRIAEIEVAHAERAAGSSQYGFWRLVNLNFDLVTGFSRFPLKVISVAGLVVSAIGLLFAAFLIVRRLVVGPESEGVFTLFAILFFFVGAQFLCVGVLGEYIGRIYSQVRSRPRYIVRVARGAAAERDLSESESRIPDESVGTGVQSRGPSMPSRVPLRRF